MVKEYVIGMIDRGVKNLMFSNEVWGDVMEKVFRIIYEESVGNKIED